MKPDHQPVKPEKPRPIAEHFKLNHVECAGQTPQSYNKTMWTSSYTLGIILKPLKLSLYQWTVNILDVYQPLKIRKIFWRRRVGPKNIIAIPFDTNLSGWTKAKLNQVEMADISRLWFTNLLAKIHDLICKITFPYKSKKRSVVWECNTNLKPNPWVSTSFNQLKSKVKHSRLEQLEEYWKWTWEYAEW